MNRLMIEIVMGVALAASAGGLIHFAGKCKELEVELKGQKALYAALVESHSKEIASLEQARKNTKVQYEKADYELLKPASIPGDDCGSAKDRALSWIKERNAK